MALPQYNTEELIQNIKRRCAVPTSQLTYTSRDWCLLANDQLQGELVPLMMSTREEFFLDFVDVLAPSDGVIPFPERAVGAKLRSVCYLQQTSPLLLINLPRIDLDIVAGVGAQWPALVGFYVQGNDLVLYPKNNLPTNTQLRLYFYRRSLVLAQPSSYGQITSIDELTNTVTLDRVPSDWITGTRLNAISSVPNFKITNALMTISAVSSPTVVLDNVLDLGVGDYLSEEGYSAIPQIPVEAHAYLAQITAATALEGLGDREGMRAAREKADLLKVGLMTLFSQRVDGSVKKVMNPTGGMLLTSGLLRRNWGSTGRF